jgi:hypothetical protein
MELVVEITDCSGHTPLILHLLRDGATRRGYKSFWYEAKWRCDDGYDEVLRNAWGPQNNEVCVWSNIGSNLSNGKRLLVSGKGDVMVPCRGK